MYESALWDFLPVEEDQPPSTVSHLFLLQNDLLLEHLHGIVLRRFFVSGQQNLDNKDPRSIRAHQACVSTDHEANSDRFLNSLFRNSPCRWSSGSQSHRALSCRTQKERRRLGTEEPTEPKSETKENGRNVMGLLTESPQPESSLRRSDTSRSGRQKQKLCYFRSTWYRIPPA